MWDGVAFPAPSMDQLGAILSCHDLDVPLMAIQPCRRPTNVIVRSGEYAAIIDWGDAGWDDPALDFAYIPLRAVPAALGGYREVAALDGDDGAEARILWDHLGLALDHLDRPARPGSADWDGALAARWVELIAGAPGFAEWLTP